MVAHDLSRHCERKRSNPSGGKTSADCFVAIAPRNDEFDPTGLPDGQITSVFPKWCQAPFAKIFLFSSDPNQFTDLPSGSDKRGVAHVINAGRDAVDAGSARDERGLLAYGQVVSF